MQYYVGLDVSLRSVALCVIDAEGKIVAEQALDCKVYAIHEFLLIIALIMYGNFR